MKAEKEPRAVTEVRRIRHKLQQEARRAGRRKYHAMLNHRRGWFIGSEPAVVREKPAKKYGQ